MIFHTHSDYALIVFQLMKIALSRNEDSLHFWVQVDWEQINQGVKSE